MPLSVSTRGIQFDLEKITNTFSLEKEESLKAKNTLFSVSVLGILYAGYDLSISSALGFKINGSTENISSFLFSATLISLVIFLFYFYRDLKKTKLLGKFETLYVEKEEQERIDKLEIRNNETRDLEERIISTSEEHTEKIEFNKKEREIYKNSIDFEFLQKNYHIFFNGFFPFFLSILSLIFLYKNASIGYIFIKLFLIIGCSGSLILILLSGLFLFLFYKYTR